MENDPESNPLGRRTAAMVGLLAGALCGIPGGVAPVIAQAPGQAGAAIVSPEVNPEGRVTFRINAPLADAVTVRGEFGNPIELVRGERGVWGGVIERV